MKTTYFHRSLRKRRMMNRIYEIKTSEGIQMKTPTEVEGEFIEYYKDLLGSDIQSRDHVNSNIIKAGNVISPSQQEDLCKPVSAIEIKAALWSIGGEKSPGPDGYSSQFYKDSWDIVKGDVVAAILNFFNSGKMLKQELRMEVY